MGQIITIPHPHSLEILDKANDLISPNIKTEKELFEIVLRHLTGTANIQDAWVVQYDPGKNSLVRMTGSGLYADDRPEGPIANECSVHKGVSGLAYRSRHVVCITDYARWPGRLDIVPRNVRYAVASPIILAPEEQPYGVLACCGDQPNMPDSLVPFVTQYALILGLALNNLRLRNALCAAEVMRERLTSTASRMEAIFYTASAIVHDFRNMLMAVSGRAELLGHILAPHQGPWYDRAQKNIEAIQEACDLNNAVCETLLRVIRGPDSTTSQGTAIGPLVCKLERILRPMVQRKGQFAIDASCNPTTSLPVSEESIVRLIMNLVTNAIEAAHPDRELEVALRIYECTHQEMDHCLRSPEETPVLRSGDGGALFVVFEVSDTGQGIPRETAERMFDLMYTTKEKGTGLGLPTVYRITKECGGHLTYSTSPSGTRFRVCLPASQSRN